MAVVASGLAQALRLLGYQVEQSGNPAVGGQSRPVLRVLDRERSRMLKLHRRLPVHPALLRKPANPKFEILNNKQSSNSSIQTSNYCLGHSALGFVYSLVRLRRIRIYDSMRQDLTTPQGGILYRSRKLRRVSHARRETDTYGMPPGDSAACLSRRRVVGRDGTLGVRQRPSARGRKSRGAIRHS